MAFRDGPFETLKVPLAWTAAAATVAAGVLAFALLLGGRASGDDQAYGALRGGVARTAGPVSGLFAAPVRWMA